MFAWLAVAVLLAVTLPARLSTMSPPRPRGRQLAEAIWAKGRLKVMLSTMPTRITMRRLVRV